MTNLFILNSVIEKDADYSQLINDLTGGFVASDIEVSEKDENGEEVVSTRPHPHADLAAPDFSGKIVFAHLSNPDANLEDVDNIHVSEFKITKAWNDGVAYAKSKGATHVALLNNVVGINPHVLGMALEGNEDKSVIGLGHGGAFIVKSDFVVEEKYNFWFVDNDIFYAAEDAGTLGFAAVEETAIVQADLTSSKEAFDAAIAEDFVTAGIE